MKYTNIMKWLGKGDWKLQEGQEGLRNDIPAKNKIIRRELSLYYFLS